jgi:predicted unusual protein kinase regulating ubiquinone biosynthesis (AarF/ABC1/UbiB family)
MIAMEMQWSQLLAALPPELEHRPELAPELALPRERCASSGPPTSRFTRLWCPSSLSAKIAAAHGLCWLRGRFAGADRREFLRAEAAWRTGLHLLGGMGYMRGAVSKAGQLLACYPNVMPEQVVELLDALHSQAPPMHFSLLRDQLEAELGDTVEHLFESFEEQAFAAASIGQVHRARVVGGAEVAVKIQYPAMARVIQADLANARMLMQPLRLGADWDNLVAQLDELARTLSAETDYQREALWTERARLGLRDVADIVVPRVFEQRSTQRVLTTELLRGDSLREYLRRDPPQEDRDRRGLAILRASLRLWGQDRFINTDAGPGNFVFLPDGRVGMLDFGSCREFTPQEWDVMMLGVRASREGGSAQLECIRASSLSPDLDARDPLVAQWGAMCDWLWEPLRHGGVFDFGCDEYMNRGVRLLGEAIRSGRTRQVPVHIWTMRQFLGIRALLWALRSRVECNALAEEEYARVGI